MSLLGNTALLVSAVGLLSCSERHLQIAGSDGGGIDGIGAGGSSGVGGAATATGGVGGAVAPGGSGGSGHGGATATGVGGAIGGTGGVGGASARGGSGGIGGSGGVSARGGTNGGAGASQPGGTGGGATTVLSGLFNRIVEFRSFISESIPYNITTGPDGNLWMTDWSIHNFFPSITPGGLVGYRGLSGIGNYGTPTGIVGGPDGNLYYAGAMSAAAVVQLPLTGNYREYPIDQARPQYIAIGPDGGLWFTDPGRNVIGRVTTAFDATLAAYPIPTASSGPLGITAGPDNALWFIETSANKVGRIALDGAVPEFAIPTAASSAQFIAAAPDGALWFTESDANKIGRITTAGAITEFGLATPDSNPTGITAGPDGAVWFTEKGAGAIGRISPAGAITEFMLQTKASQPFGITVGPDGNIWFTELGASLGLARIGRLTPESKPFCRLTVSQNIYFASGCPAPTQSVVITNTGATPSGKLAVTADAANPPDLAHFLIDDKCSGLSLNAGDRCTLDVSFVPSADRTGTFAITIKVTPALGDSWSIYVHGNC